MVEGGGWFPFRSLGHRSLSSLGLEAYKMATLVVSDDILSVFESGSPLVSTMG